MSSTRIAAFAVVTALTAFTLVSGAQTKKPARPPAAAAKKPAAKHENKAEKDEDAGPSTLAAKEERTTPGAKDTSTEKVEKVEKKELDGGQALRFTEAVDVEGRLKSPQLVYFLRRVRAEFAAGDLGHRSFMRELSETRNEPGL